MSDIHEILPKSDPDSHFSVLTGFPFGVPEFVLKVAVSGSASLQGQPTDSASITCARHRDFNTPLFGQTRFGLYSYTAWLGSCIATYRLVWTIQSSFFLR